MRPKFKTESNAIYHALALIAKEGKPEPSQAAFEAQYRIRRNSKGYVFHRTPRIANRAV
jgi:hypothetical protein